MRLGIDVDITLVETGYEWWKWLSDCESYGLPYHIKDHEVKGKFDYNLGTYFPDYESVTGCNPYSFWSQDNLYDWLPPLPNSAKVIRKLAEAGHEIVFISHSKKGHLSSKVKWLKKWFPEADIGGKGSFIATKEKHFVGVDVMIDDRVENLLKFKDEVVKVYFGSIYEDTPFNKHEVDFITSDDCDKGWFELENYFEELEII